MALHGPTSVPVSALNIGLNAGLPVVGARIGELQLEISNLQDAISLSAQVALGLPDPASFQALLSSGLNAAELSAQLNPASLISGGIDANADILIRLGLLDVAIGITAPVLADFETGLNSGGLAAWTYTGGAAAFGQSLRKATASGLPGAASSDIQAIVIATQDFSTWGGFSLGFNTGSTAEQPAAPQAHGVLAFLGRLGGGQLNTGVLRLLNPFTDFLQLLVGERGALEAQLDITLGVNIPDITAILDTALGIDIGAALGNFGVFPDFSASIGSVNLKLDAALQLEADIGVALSGGGLSVWTYAGSAQGLGAEFETAVQNGLPGVNEPNAPTYGMVIATELPAAWAAFGSIFGV